MDLSKSAATGHLIFKWVDWQKKHWKIEEAADIGKGSFRDAWVLDKLKDRHQHGITIDINLWKSETASTMWPSLVPQNIGIFLKNIITSLPQSDCCLGCYWGWWIWGRYLQEWADPWSCPSGLHTGCKITNCWC